MRPDLRLLSLLWQKSAAAPLKLGQCSPRENKSVLSLNSVILSEGEQNGCLFH
jgi:hypothetical protein